MRYHLLAPDVRCPSCGAALTFVRIRRFADLYSCTSGDRCRCQVLHYRSKKTRACGYSTLSASGAFGVWNACCIAKELQTERLDRRSRKRVAKDGGVLG